jgi:hypothetical protein
MKREQEIEVVVGPDGEVTINVRGGSGKSCLDATKFLEEGLGLVGRRNLLPEYHAKDQVRQQLGKRRPS